MGYLPQLQLQSKQALTSSVVGGHPTAAASRYQIGASGPRRAAGTVATCFPRSAGPFERWLDPGTSSQQK